METHKPTTERPLTPLPADDALEAAEDDLRARAEQLGQIAYPNTGSSASLLESAVDLSGVDVLARIKNRYSEDPFFAQIINSPRDFKNFEVSDGVVYLLGRHTWTLCIPHVTVDRRSSQELVISHAHLLLAHLGASKTLAYLRDQVWWKSMGADIRKFCDLCVTCRQGKPNNQKPFGLLNPLSVPVRPWEFIGIDFVRPLPASRNRDGEYDMIATIICLLTLHTAMNFMALKIHENSLYKWEECKRIWGPCTSYAKF
jgi:hypothetical protein